MGFALIRAVVGCGLCCTRRGIYTNFSMGCEGDIGLNPFVSASFLLLQVTVKVKERKRLKKTGIMRMWRVKRK